MIMLLAFLLFAPTAPLHAQSLSTADASVAVPPSPGAVGTSAAPASAAPQDSAPAPEGASSSSPDATPASAASTDGASGAGDSVASASSAQASGTAAPGAGGSSVASEVQGASPALGAASAMSRAPKPYPGSRSLTDLLGMTLAQVFAQFGAPEEIFPIRGTQSWQDDVVFYYPDHSYLFWYRDRVWQARVDRRFASAALGFSMGESRGDVIRSSGTPFHADESSMIYVLPDRGFPVRARLFFENDRLVDLYVYRGDF